MRCEFKFRHAFLLVASLAIVRTAAAQIQIEGPKDLAIQGWVGEPHSGPPPAAKADTKPVDLVLKNASPKALAFAYDPAANRLAQKNPAEIAGIWALKATELTRIGRVVVAFQSGGKPVASLTYRVKSGTESWVGLIAPADKGETTLWSIPPGDLEISASYRVGGETKALVPTPKYPLRLEDAASLQKIVIALPDGVDVVGAAEPATKNEKPDKTPPAAEKPEGFDGGRLFVYLAGLAVGCAAIYALIRVSQTHRETIDQQLSKLGVAIPTDPNPADTSTDPVTPGFSKASGPTPQIILDDAPAVATVLPGAVATAANPRLVLDGGDVILIPDGATTLGRDAGVDHPMPDQNTLSRQHARFDRSGTAVTITDLGSTNGTFINGVKLESGTQTLQPGDQVQFGALSTRYQI